MKKVNEIIPKSTFETSFQLAKKAVLIALILTPIRFILELAGLPESTIFLIGLLWLTLSFSIYWGIKLGSEKQSYIILLMALLIYSPISRIPVAVFWWIDTKWEIGTHYGDYFNNFGQAFLNQVGYGSLIQIIPGFLLGSITLAIMSNRKLVTKKINSLENE